MRLVIVESPAKANTIENYLGKGYKVIASFGHIRALPSKNHSVLPEENFRAIYELTKNAEKHFSKIEQAAKNASEILLATDPDREGEAISWHIIEALKEKGSIKNDITVKRIVFFEITKNAILKAIEDFRKIDMDLVKAQQARQILDYLVGFNLSPVLWRKLPGCRSAGRVQSVALRLVTEREIEIEKFTKQEYWSINLECISQNKSKFLATLFLLDEKKLQKFDIPNQEEANKVTSLLQKLRYQVHDIQKKRQNRNPSPAFITSSLQQEAARKLGFSAKKTMQVAQKLYEGLEIDNNNTALITYMRTDSVNISKEAIGSIRQYISSEFGTEYLPTNVRTFKTKAKNAQEAHEAIRPVDINITPQYLTNKIEKDFLRLYDLIWRRALATQMTNAIFDITTIIISDKANKAMVKASGSVMVFDGFYKLYVEGKDDESDEKVELLPNLAIGELIDINQIIPKQHFTEPPPRYTEASLVKTLEELGIGRPSTYASIISVLQERNYVKIEKKRFFPEERGRILSVFLNDFFQKYVEYDFTANLENELDEIASGNLDIYSSLTKFWVSFKENIDQVTELKIQDILSKIETELFPEKNPCPKCNGGILGLRLGKFGAFLSCSQYPECNFTSSIYSNNQEEIHIENNNSLLGKDTQNNEINLKKGPYGWYIETIQNGKKKRASIPKEFGYEKITLEDAIFLLSLPKFISEHTKFGDITLQRSKYGFYLNSGEHNTKIPKEFSPKEITPEKAKKIIEEALNKKNKPKSKK